MKRKLAIGVGSLVMLVLLLGAGARIASGVKEARTYDATLADIEIPTSPDLAEGERLYIARGCGGSDCHQADGGGAALMVDGPLGTITSANLTTLAAAYTGRDFDRAVRHGMRGDRTSLIFMPAGDYVDMPDRELALIVAYVRSLPPVSRALPATEVSMLSRVIDLADGFELFPASAIDHDYVLQPDIPPGRTVENGHMLARLCTGCHGPRLSGGPIPGAPPELGMPRNITFHATGLAGWSEEDLRTALRTGVVPDGSTLDARQMPWPIIARMTDDEIGALYLYLQTVPHAPEGNR
jgi:mono/diheme cytochrome c family protein